MHYAQLKFTCLKQDVVFIRELPPKTLNTYKIAVSPTLDLLCHEDFNVGRSEADGNHFYTVWEIQNIYVCSFCVCKSCSTFKNHMVYLLNESRIEVFS